LAVLGLLAVRLLRRPATRVEGATLAALLAAQILLGIQNVVLSLPLPNAVAHNGMGALLLAMMLWLLYRSGAGKNSAAAVPA
jgi:cytochrome c oxidase assembly protein subunit 15